MRIRLMSILCGIVAASTLFAVQSCSDSDSMESATATVTATPVAITPDAERGPTQMELPIRVAVTLPIFVEFAKEAGGENVEVISLIPDGADPHSYEFTSADIERMKGIDFFFFNGLGLDDRLEAVIEENRDENSFVIPFSPNIRSPQGGGLTATQADDNSHLWLDPDLAYIYPEIAADEYIIYDGIREDFYTSNFVAARERALQTMAEVQQIVSTVPAERRKLVTLHDSFDHFGRRFGLTQSNFVTPTPGSPVSDEQINRTIQAVRDQQIPAVFAEFGYDRTAMERIGNETGVPVCTLYSDIIGGEIDTYRDLMLANAREIARCLGGS
jgi:ABC-type Zn uptake system ZnuABC Zn-binding protein ZnuA